MRFWRVGKSPQTIAESVVDNESRLETICLHDLYQAVQVDMNRMNDKE